MCVTNGRTGTCIITASYEARAVGIKTGMRLREARTLAPNLIQAPSRPQRYGQVSSSIMSALESITPELEIFSVDEAFLDITSCQPVYDCTMEELGQKIDAVNHRFGEFTLCKAPLLNRSDMPNVISPAWRPNGHRNTLES